MLAEQHRHTLMVGRTLLQQALPITFGLKAARWLALTTRQLQALLAHREMSLAVQLGGAAGTLASLGNNGLQVIEFLALELDLPAPNLPWHAERDRVAEIAATLGIIAGAMSKIAEDIVLLAQTRGRRSSGRQSAGERRFICFAAETQSRRCNDGTCFSTSRHWRSTGDSLGDDART